MTDPRDPSGGRRTVVVSDAHAHTELIANALRHARFDPDAEFLVYAGDLVDGPNGIAGTQECIDLLRENGARFLWGNHDVAALLDYSIDGQDADTRPYWTGPFQHEFWSDAQDRWRQVVCVQGVLVSHGGLSTDYQNDRDFSKDGRGGYLSDPYVLADWLSAKFDEAARRQLGSHKRDRLARIMGRRAPHRFRPFNSGVGPGLVLRGVTQVAGHSAEELYGARSDAEVRRGKWRAAQFADVGLHLIDPCYQVRGGTDRCRYAVIEDGDVTVHET